MMQYNEEEDLDFMGGRYRKGTREIIAKSKVIWEQKIYPNEQPLIYKRKLILFGRSLINSLEPTGLTSTAT